ncbi:hypothetical protein V6Z11_D11G300100 [Gossypium hirsutum]
MTERRRDPPNPDDEERNRHKWKRSGGVGGGSWGRWLRRLKLGFLCFFLFLGLG